MLNKTKIYRNLAIFLPSSMSAVLCVFLAGAGMLLNQFDMVRAYLELPHDLRLTRLIAEWADTLLTATVGAERTQSLVVGLFWALVGLGVYVFLRGLAQIFIELDDDLEARRYIWPRGADRERPLHTLLHQVVFRGIAFIGLIFVVFVPLAAVLRGPVFVDFLGPGKLLQYVVWALASLLLWHFVVVLLRLVALRPRLFG